uniref:Uncharacterized protein n=1 Tax=Arundo donax TaxID=35708 RepID=A0A0A9CGJ4_ARUDO
MDSEAETKNRLYVASMVSTTSFLPSLRKSLGGCVEPLQMSSKSGSRKQPSPMPKG